MCDAAAFSCGRSTGPAAATLSAGLDSLQISLTNLSLNTIATVILPQAKCCVC